MNDTLKEVSRKVSEAAELLRQYDADTQCRDQEIDIDTRGPISIKFEGGWQIDFPDLPHAVMFFNGGGFSTDVARVCNIQSYEGSKKGARVLFRAIDAIAERNHFPLTITHVSAAVISYITVDRAEVARVVGNTNEEGGDHGEA